MKKAFDLDAAIADPQRIMVPITKDQRSNLRYWDFMLWDLQARIDRQKAMKEARETDI